MLRYTALSAVLFTLGITGAATMGGWKVAPQINRYEGTIERISPENRTMVVKISSNLNPEAPRVTTFSYTDDTAWFTLTRRMEDGHEIAGVNTSSEPAAAIDGQPVIIVATTDEGGRLVMTTTWLITVI